MADTGICTQAVKDEPITPRSCMTNEAEAIQTIAGRAGQRAS